MAIVLRSRNVLALIGLLLVNTVSASYHDRDGRYQPPPLALADLNDNPHSLKLHRGKVIVINFWAIWCSPCREELPTLEAA